MPISVERLTLATEILHHAAEDNHLVHGHTLPALMLIPTDGAPHLCVLPQGLPQDDHLRDLVRHVGATAIALTGEVWVSEPGIRPETLLRMPLDDLARPEDDPQRQEAILTTGVGITPNGPTTVLNISMIEPDASGSSVLRPVSQAGTGLRTDGTAAYLTSLLI